MPPPSPARASLLIGLAGFALLATGASGCNLGFYQGPDRPGDPAIEGPPPPADFHCEQGERRTEDTDHDGHPDRVVHVLGTGAVLCSTEDRNHDGKIDTWNRIENGQVVEQATDSDFDGTLDRRVLIGARSAPGGLGAPEAKSPLVILPPITPLLPLRPTAPGPDAGH